MESCETLNNALALKEELLSEACGLLYNLLKEAGLAKVASSALNDLVKRCIERNDPLVTQLAFVTIFQITGELGALEAAVLMAVEGSENQKDMVLRSVIKDALKRGDKEAISAIASWLSRAGEDFLVDDLDTLQQETQPADAV